VYRFLWTLPMFQLSIVPREAVEAYGARFGRHPVGTGPFLMAEGAWVESKSMTFTRNPRYHACTYPSAWTSEDQALGLHRAAGQRLPFVERVEVTMFVQENPMWLEFLSGGLDFTQVPSESFLEAFHQGSRSLRKELAERGIVAHAVPMLDFIFHGFNMEDPVVGGYSAEQRALRQAIALAIDEFEIDDTFYNGTNVVYDGMIPPGLDGHPAGGRGPISWLGPDVERARELMRQAGHPEGQGLPAIEYFISQSGNGSQQAEMMQRQLSEIGVELVVRSLSFPQLMETINRKKAQFFSFAWSSDYPDGENNLALFYGPNAAPGVNHFNYRNPRFDELYERIATMRPGAERTALYERMRDMVLADTPFVGSKARTRFYLVHPWLENLKPDETFYNWIKYLDVDESARAR
jgi:ABC-type transport system substrate-binding protein